MPRTASEGARRREVAPKDVLSRTLAQTLGLVHEVQVQDGEP